MGIGVGFHGHTSRCHCSDLASLIGIFRYPEYYVNWIKYPKSLQAANCKELTSVSTISKPNQVKCALHKAEKKEKLTLSNTNTKKCLCRPKGQLICECETKWESEEAIRVKLRLIVRQIIKLKQCECDRVVLKVKRLPLLACEPDPSRERSEKSYGFGRYQFPKTI